MPPLGGVGTPPIYVLLHGGGAKGWAWLPSPSGFFFRAGVSKLARKQGSEAGGIRCHEAICVSPTAATGNRRWQPLSVGMSEKQLSSLFTSSSYLPAHALERTITYPTVALPSHLLPQDKVWQSAAKCHLSTSWPMENQKAKAGTMKP